MRARVKPFNRYGNAEAGQLVDVDESEFTRVPWCLERADETAEERGERVERESDTVRVAQPFVEHMAAAAEQSKQQLGRRRK